MSGRVVEFASTSNTICRPARDNKRDVIQRFTIYDPYRVYIEGGILCERGRAHARDVA
jgi:hypothetical protein